VDGYPEPQQQRRASKKRNAKPRRTGQRCRHFFPDATPMNGKTHALSVKPMAGLAPRSAFHERERAVSETARFAIREIGDVVGTWATCDGFVRHTLFPDGRCEESQGSRSCVFSGCYVLHGQRIDYQYDGDFFGFGEFIAGELHQGGMVLHRISDARTR
jgi:hypothetical protein